MADSAPPPETSTRRSPLPWQAVVACTLLAAVVAIGVALVLSGGDDGDDTARDGASSLTLVPQEEVDVDDALSTSFVQPDGSDATLADIVEGPTVVNFFASWCPPCIGEMPDFESASQALDGSVTFFGLAVQDRPEDAERIVDQTGITYGWGRDRRGDIAGAVGVIQMPTTMFLDAEGTVVAVQSGAIDEDRLLALVEEHLGVTA